MLVMCLNFCDELNLLGEYLDYKITCGCGVENRLYWNLERV